MESSRAPPTRRERTGSLTLQTHGQVVVLGGTGFVGSKVVEALVARGAAVTSISRSGKPAAIAGADQVTWRAADVASADLAPLLDGASVVISCIGEPP